MNFKEFYENFDFIFGEDITPEDADMAYKMAKKYGIGVLSDKDLYAIIKDGDEVVGGLWTSWLSSEFSFDIVVNEKYQGQGLGSKLADMAIQTYNQDKEAYEEPVMRAYVVNPSMEKILARKGFEVENRMPGQTVMVKK